MTTSCDCLQPDEALALVHSHECESNRDETAMRGEQDRGGLMQTLMFSATSWARLPQRERLGTPFRCGEHRKWTFRFGVASGGI